MEILRNAAAIEVGLDTDRNVERFRPFAVSQSKREIRPKRKRCSCQFRTFIAREIAKCELDYALSSSSSVFASLRSAVPKPSVNQP
jgi:hypothetical protein